MTYRTPLALATLCLAVAATLLTVGHEDGGLAAGAAAFVLLTIAEGCPS